MLLAELLNSDLEALVSGVAPVLVDEPKPAVVPIRIAPAIANASDDMTLTGEGSIAQDGVLSLVQSDDTVIASAAPTGFAAASLPPPVDESPTASSVDAVASFLGAFRQTHVDFDVKTNPQLREQEYSWKEHGFALVNRFYPGLGPLLDAELDLIFEYTENNLGDGVENVDTGPFRRAIWYYSNRLFGVVTADFDYRQVNVFLKDRTFKSFLKRAVCLPETLCFAEFRDALGRYSFRPSEKLHVVLLAAEGRRQACQLFALHAVMKHMM